MTERCAEVLHTDGKEFQHVVTKQLYRIAGTTQTIPQLTIALCNAHALHKVASQSAVFCRPGENSPTLHEVAVSATQTGLCCVICGQLDPDVTYPLHPGLERLFGLVRQCSHFTIDIIRQLVLQTFSKSLRRPDHWSALVVSELEVQAALYKDDQPSTRTW